MFAATKCGVKVLSAKVWGCLARVFCNCDPNDHSLRYLRFGHSCPPIMKTFPYSVSFALQLLLACAVSLETFNWMHQITLDSDNRFHVKWLFNSSQEFIVFNLCVRTKGWIGFGISPHGGMTGSDLIIAWVDSYGRAHLQVRRQFTKDDDFVHFAHFSI